MLVLLGLTLKSWWLRPCFSVRNKTLYICTFPVQKPCLSQSVEGHSDQRGVQNAMNLGPISIRKFPSSFKIVK